MDTTGQTDEQNTDTSAKSRQKRSRAGCLTCRSRRRKCDEGKPGCQNCISKGFACRYASAFQILGKHNFTPEVPTKAVYKEVQFVSVYDDKTDQKEPGKHAEESNSKDTTSPVAQSTGPQQSTSPQNDRSTNILSATHIQSPSAERYEFALHGLLALGSVNGGADVNGESEVNSASMDFNEPHHAALPNQVSIAVDQFPTEPNSMIVGEFQERLSLQSWPSMSTIPSVEIPQIADECILEYLTHYRYKIAPWMDICDMKQCFGCEVLHLSKTSSSTQLEILALAEASLAARQQFQGVSGNMRARVQRQKDPSGDKVHQALLDAFGTVKAVVTNLSEFWNDQNGIWYSQHALEPLLSEINRDPSGKSGPLASATFWLIARLRKCYAGFAVFGTPVSNSN
ncbi:hypothetical protein P171DRAFT_435619 [Karstenula rhodostoma CBS 690.94]|uniref:Zn(2)-C6 fungal-type domain-containing protein n=1 Tax=Karstenula rhodostoma CBS 690.94 TaxID=1392251 RepID=A0A9P4PAX4_9PLEO|nr:hypothetical protein P171DRAFT_435619 [Karstenula rhodostoma CBS 690.94]